MATPASSLRGTPGRRDSTPEDCRTNTNTVVEVVGKPEEPAVQQSQGPVHNTDTDTEPDTNNKGNSTDHNHNKQVRDSTVQTDGPKGYP